MNDFGKRFVIDTNALSQNGCAGCPQGRLRHLQRLGDHRLHVAVGRN